MNLKEESSGERKKSASKSRKGNDDKSPRKRPNRYPDFEDESAVDATENNQSKRQNTREKTGDGERLVTQYKSSTDRSENAHARLSIPDNQSSGLRSTNSRAFTFAQPAAMRNTHIYCAYCLKWCKAKCSAHRYKWISNKEVPFCDCRAAGTLPRGLVLSPSETERGQLGVWANVRLERNTVFGPAEGVRIPCSAASSCRWQIFKDGKLTEVIDSSDATNSNWLRFIRHSQYPQNQNVMPFQRDNNIYYLTVKTIERNTEVVAWSGREYAHTVRQMVSVAAGNTAAGRSQTSYRTHPVSESASHSIIGRENQMCSSRRAARQGSSLTSKEQTDPQIFCSICMKWSTQRCKMHGYTFVANKAVPFQEDRAKITLPSGLAIRESLIVGAGLGVWADVPLRANTVFGPCEGKRIPYNKDNPRSPGSYCWQIVQNGEVVIDIDGSDTTTSNWLRYVNCARTFSEQNLISFQYDNNVYYMTICDIKPETELLVWYGDEYARILFNEKDIGETDVDGVSERKMIDGLPASSSKSRSQRGIHRIDTAVPVSEKENIPTSQHVDAKAKKEATRSASHSVNTPRAGGGPLSFKDSNRDRQFVQTSQEEPSSSSISAACADTIAPTVQASARQYLINCDLCRYKFFSMDELNKHMATHSGDLPYMCKMCGAGFFRKCSLDSHRLGHK